MGKVMSIVSRKVNRFNVESRAHRVLERDKPTPAPKYESNLRDMERALEVDPDIIEKLNRKDGSLNERLKNVYVTSEDRFIDHRDDPNRTLPLNRTAPEEFEYGFPEPQNVPPGRYTLRQAMTFITDHHSNPEVWTKERIAEEYKLKPERVANILNYYKPFNVYIPDKTYEDNVLTQSNRKLLKEGEIDEKEK